jgi:adenosylhomocysteine nucleosidase
MMRCGARWRGSGRTGMPKIAIVAALEREVSGLIRNWRQIERQYEGRKFAFFERDEIVVVCGGIGADATRRAAEAVIGIYHPMQVQSVGFAGGLDRTLHVGDIFLPSVVIDARDGSRIETGDEYGRGVLVTFMAVAGVEQKAKLGEAYKAMAVDMDAAAVAAAARAHGIGFGAIKVISDEVDFEMPGMALFTTEEGQFKTASFVLFAAMRPWMWMRVASLARNSGKAEKALSAYLESFLRQQTALVEAKPA